MTVRIRSCAKLPANMLVDGEAVAIGENGRISFNALQHCADGQAGRWVAGENRQTRNYGVMFLSRNASRTVRAMLG
jgi:ATP-dependent DNA ligase